MSHDLFQFAGEHPFVAFCMLWLVCWILSVPFTVIFKIWNRTLRSRNILKHGWPTAPVDADGDVVYQSREEDAR